MALCQHNARFALLNLLVCRRKVFEQDSPRHAIDNKMMHDQQEPLAAVSEIHSNQAQKRSGQRQTSLGRRSDGGDFGSIANPASTPKQFRGLRCGAVIRAPNAFDLFEA